MARIRTVKPEFWTSEQIVECSPMARLLFIGMWNFCDDQGIHPASTKRLKMEIFPGDSIQDGDIVALIQELESVNLIRSYSIDGKDFWIVTGWNHQKIDRPTNRYPLPDRSLDSQRDLDEPSPPEGKGRETKGKEGKGREIDTDQKDSFIKRTSETVNGSAREEYLVESILKRVGVHDADELSTIRRIAAMVDAKLISEQQIQNAAEGVSCTSTYKRSPIAYFIHILQDNIPDFNDLLKQIPAKGE